MLRHVAGVDGDKRLFVRKYRRLDGGSIRRRNQAAGPGGNAAIRVARPSTAQWREGCLEQVRVSGWCAGRLGESGLAARGGDQAGAGQQAKFTSFHYGSS